MNPNPCEPGECGGDPTYTEPYVVPALPENGGGNGGGGDTPQYDIPYFDGGEYGAVAYLDADGRVAYYTATSSNDLEHLDSLLALVPQTRVFKTFDDGSTINAMNILSYSLPHTPTVVPGNFLSECYNLQSIYNIEYATSIGANFLQYDYNFNSPLTLSADLTSIGNDFLYNCTRFNSLIIFEGDYCVLNKGFLEQCIRFNQPLSLPQANTVIPERFMYGCQSFNSPLVLPPNTTRILNDFLHYAYDYNQPLNIPATCTQLGSYFLNGCRSFNQPLPFLPQLTSLPQEFLSSCTSFNQPLELPNVTTIPARFLYACHSFNQPITIPEKTSTINKSFLERCSSFAQPLTLPAKVTSIGNNFLYNDYSFTGPLEILTSKIPESAGASQNLVVNKNYAPAYENGVLLTGPNAQAWKDNLPDMAVATSYFYRHLIVDNSTEEDTV